MSEHIKSWLKDLAKNNKEQQVLRSKHVQATGIPPHVAVMHHIRSMGEALERRAVIQGHLAVIQGHLADEVDARMNETLDARAIGGGAKHGLFNLFDKGPKICDNA